MFAPLHSKKIVSIRAQELQDCITAKNCKSKTTIGNMRAIIRGMWSYAINNEYTENDITQHLVFEYTNTDTPIHTRFTDAEINLLWQSLYVINNVDIILIYIYTGMRPVELLDIKSEDVHLNERYMIGGAKTEAGKNRIIPICDAIAPLIEKRLDEKRPYLITNKYGNHYTRAVYSSSNFITVINKLNLNHTPHDCRYTFSALADTYGMNQTCQKIIMGHSLQSRNGNAFKTGGKTDVTKDVYTEKTIAQLVQEVNKLPVSFL